MRITFVCPQADLSGGFRVIVVYAKRLRDRGHEVSVVTRPLRRPTMREVLRSIYRRRPLPTVPRDAITHLTGTGLNHIQLESFRAPVAADVLDADVIIATWWETAEWVWDLPASKGVKVHFIQDYETWAGHITRVDATCRLPMPKITPARWVKTMLADQFDQHDVTLAPNAVDLKTFTAPARGKQPTPTVGFTYTSFAPKGCDITMQAITLARATRPDLKVVCFGSTKPIPEIPLPENVEFHLRAPESKLKGLYGQCDAWLFGTRKEGFGLPILEAMACRTPVIGTPAGAAPELLEQGGGIQIPMEDPRAMADAILKVVAMPEAQWKQMSDAAYATASRYTWEDATNLFEDALIRAAGKSDGQSVARASRPRPVVQNAGETPSPR
jgi:glycosyltransferase involved in cell wall biosynthesis